ncbi:sulfite exporter TauE/SafE family protein [Patescibacteria group bacterium]|nr:sulfite exporter TauE/SafE family protein [Patescibacteria group bacterium]
MAKIKEHIYSVKGMHCASCEILIEKKLLAFKSVKSADASNAKGKLLIEYEDKKPTLEKLNSIFLKEGYTFFDVTKNIKAETNKNSGIGNSIFIGLLIIAGFIILNKLGLAGLINVNSKSSLPAFFVFGLLAGISTCAALVGGLILSMSKQWLQLYAQEPSTIKKLQPHLMFNIGRLLSYIFFGFLLGLLGNKFRSSLTFTSFLIIAISIMMLFVALQMLGVKKFKGRQFSLPKFITRRIANEKNFKRKNMPFLMGALTFFLPCGFTITSQGLALLSGSPIQGALIMGFFALGTFGPLLAIGLSSIKMSQKPHLAYRFTKIAGILILFFALFNINSQMNILGFFSLNDIALESNTSTESKNKNLEGLTPIVDGKQILKMGASSRGYSPNYFKVKAGIPIRWEITDKGTSGCTNAVISKNLFDGAINLTPGQVSVKEFTPTNPGRYKFSCWMGMVTGTIEVIDVNNTNSTPTTNLNTTVNNISDISSGASGCGCGGGGGCGGGSCGGSCNIK